MMAGGPKLLLMPQGYSMSIQQRCQGFWQEPIAAVQCDLCIVAVIFN
jgi:hypothetical protein